MVNAKIIPMYYARKRSVLKGYYNIHSSLRLANKLLSVARNDKSNTLLLEVLCYILLNRKDADFAKPYCHKILDSLDLDKESTNEKLEDAIR